MILYYCYIYRTFHIGWIFGGGKLWQISHQKFLTSKTLANSCLLTLFMLQDIVKSGMIKFGEPPVNMPNSPRLSSTENSRYMVLTVMGKPMIVYGNVCIVKEWLHIVCKHL